MNQEKWNNSDQCQSRSSLIQIDPRVFDKNTPVCVSPSDNDNVVKDIKAFDEAGFQPLLLKNLAEAGYNIPTTVQRHAIPIIMAGRDLMACADNCTGKTAAFLLPIINTLMCSIKDSEVYPATPQVLVITPTTMGALQIYDETKKLIKGSSIIARWWVLRCNDCHILIVTPRMLMDYSKKYTVNFMRLKFLVMCEADFIMDYFELKLKDWIEGTNMPNSEERQTLMFSTEFSYYSQHLATNYLKDHLFLTVGSFTKEDCKGNNTEVRRVRDTELETLDISMVTYISIYEAIKYINWFNESGLNSSLLCDLTMAGYDIPTLVQRQVIPIIMGGRDLMACAVTGTGKTAAYLIPIIHMLLYSESDRAVAMSSVTPRVLVITPNIGLAKQVYNEARKITRSSAIITEVADNRDSSSEYHCHILIATQEWLLNIGWVEGDEVDLSNVDFLVLDEVDCMVDMFKVTNLPDKWERQTLMFSTQFSKRSKVGALDYIKNDYLFLNIENVCGEEHTKISELISHGSLTELSGSGWDHQVSSRELYLEQAVTNLTSKLEKVSTLAMEMQERNKDIQETNKEMQERNKEIQETNKKIQETNNQLQREVENLQRKNASSEKKPSADTQNQSFVNSTPGLVTIVKEDMSQLLASCEYFQKKLDDMDDRQQKFENKQHIVENNLRCLSNKFLKS